MKKSKTKINDIGNTYYKRKQYSLGNEVFIYDYKNIEIGIMIATLRGRKIGWKLVPVNNYFHDRDLGDIFSTKLDTLTMFKYLVDNGKHNVSEVSQ